MWVHRLSNVDVERRTAVCAYCGPVRVRRHKNSYRCSTAEYLSDIKLKYGAQFDKRPLRCQVCDSSIRIVYDHSHQSQQFRGWLCNACNVALGLVKDRPDVLRALAAYLENRE